MKKVILFGAGELAKRWLSNIDNETQIVAIADNAYKDIVVCCGHPVIDPKNIIQYEFDELIITLDDLKKGNDQEIINVISN